MNTILALVGIETLGNKCHKKWGYWKGFGWVVDIPYFSFMYGVLLRDEKSLEFYLWMWMKYEECINKQER